MTDYRLWATIGRTNAQEYPVAVYVASIDPPGDTRARTAVARSREDALRLQYVLASDFAFQDGLSITESEFVQ